MYVYYLHWIFNLRTQSIFRNISYGLLRIYTYDSRIKLVVSTDAHTEKQ